LADYHKLSEQLWYSNVLIELFQADMSISQQTGKSVNQS